MPSWLVWLHRGIGKRFVFESTSLVGSSQKLRYDSKYQCSLAASFSYIVRLLC